MKDYPVSEGFDVLGGHDIYKSNNIWIAIVAVRSSKGKDLRLYRWVQRNDQWKVDLCRMSIGTWNLEYITQKANELKLAYGIY